MVMSCISQFETFLPHSLELRGCKSLHVIIKADVLQRILVQRTSTFQKRFRPEAFKQVEREEADVKKLWNACLQI
jgi:hypothetical protein